MLKIRLQRIGRKNDPAFRVVVTEHTRGPKTGKHVELLGSYDPRQDSSALKTDRIKHWISKGAQVSGTVHNLLVNERVIEGKKVNVLPRKSPIKKEGEASAEEVTSTEASDSEAPLEAGAEGSVDSNGEASAETVEAASPAAQDLPAEASVETGASAQAEEKKEGPSAESVSEPASEQASEAPKEEDSSEPVSEIPEEKKLQP